MFKSFNNNKIILNLSIRQSLKLFSQDDCCHLLWLQVKHAALPSLHVVQGPVHSQGDAFVSSLPHSEADVPAVEQSASTAALQVHYGKTTGFNLSSSW